MKTLLLRHLGRLSVGRKLLLIFLLDMSAVAFISGILIHEKYIAIDFARKEIAGNAYIAETRGVLLDVAASPSKALPPQTLERHAAALRQSESRYGRDMGAEELNRSVQDALGAVAAGAPNVRPAIAIEKGRELLTRVGNLSNLILDPDLDSYYTMSIVLLRAPELLSTVTGITAQIEEMRGARAIPDKDARGRFLLLEGRLDAVRQGLESDYNEAFAASTPMLRARLAASRGVLLESVERYRRSARRAMDGSVGSVASEELVASHADLLLHLDRAWTLAGRELDRLLATRIDAFFNRMWLHLGTALALLGVILTAVFYVARQIAMPLRRLLAVAETVRRTGDHTLRASWDSRDEIGRLVLGFNDMLEQLDRHREVQQELAARERATRAQQQLLEAIPIPLMVTAIPGHQVLHANEPAQDWLGHQTNDPWHIGLDPSVRVRFFQQLADRDSVNEFEVRWKGTAEPSWAVLSARRLDFQGQAAVLTTFAPINHLKLMERRLELWAKVFEASGEGIVIVNAEHHILTANRAFCHATLLELHEVVGEPLHCIDDGDAWRSFLEPVWPLADKRGTWQGEVAIRRRDGTVFPAWLMISVVREANRNAVSHYIATIIDITDRKQNEERIRFLAQHDVLTQLPNRSLCIERLRLATQQAERSGQKVAVLFIDLDRFKYINDSLGHHVGDGLLRSVAGRIVGSVRQVDTVSRLGGDEFVVILNGVADVDEVRAIVDDRLLPMVAESHDVDSVQLHVSCSVGIAIYPDDARDIDTLMRHADAAMYHAKAQGRDSARFFTPELNERAQSRLQIESNLRHAIERDELALHFQPRVDARTRRLLGVEALLRWNSPALGPVAPHRFISIAEETGLIIGIGAWVIEEACRQHRAWRHAGIEIPQVSINVSALQVRDGSLVETLRDALQMHAMPHGSVEIELTETTLMDSVDKTLVQLHAIKRLGVELAIDDFGTGYSSLNYLNRFPIDRLKIDRSFVRDMLDDPTDLAITRAIIGLGHTLNLKVVAEGVETEREAETLRASNCDELQGYLIAKPMPADKLEAWLGLAKTLPVASSG